MPKVLNIYTHGRPLGAVYVGRPSPWGNPFVIGKHGDRSEVIEKYRQMVFSDPKLLAQIKRQLRGKDLLCYCKPRECHADVLLEIANIDDGLGS